MTTKFSNFVEIIQKLLHRRKGAFLNDVTHIGVSSLVTTTCMKGQSGNFYIREEEVQRTVVGSLHDVINIARLPCLFELNKL